jgi:CubicO group peptidase (beta-lactamase class C family)
MKPFARILWWCVLALSVVPLRAAKLPEALDDFDAYVDRTLAEFRVPGLAVAIVKDGEVVLARGYGVKRVGEPARVDAHTLFAIASNTKAITAAALAQLVDDGKLAWDDPVTKHLPGFQMADPYVTHEMTVRDLLTHRSGLSLGAGDLLYFPASTFTPAEIVHRLRFIPLATSFRSYDNILYIVSGQLFPAVAGQSWQHYVRDHILTPVGMNETKTSLGEIQPGDNVATGHALGDFKTLAPVPSLSWDNGAPAGAIYSNVSDLAKWITVQLNGGRLPAGPDGRERRLFQAARQRDMWSLITPIPISEPPPALAATKPNFNGYGLGWNLSDYRGKKLVSHTGGFPGMVSKVAMVPELKLGVVVLTNQEQGAAFQAVSLRVLDAFYGVAPTDWIAAYVELLKKRGKEADDGWQKHVAARAADAKPSLPLARYAGTYRDAWYGDVAIAEEGGKLVMRFSHSPQLTGELEPWQHDTFIARWSDRTLNADAWVTFALTPDGGIDQIKLAPISPLTDFSFDFQDLLLKPAAK